MKYFLSALFICFFANICFSDANSLIRLVSVSVQVVNGTSNGKSVEGDEVFLRVFRHDRELQVLDATADKNGIAVFNDVYSGDHVLGVISVIHKDMCFGGNSITLNTDANSFHANVQVFDTSGDLSKVSVSTHHMSIKMRQNALLITEYLQLENSSDTAITSSQRDEEGRPIILKMMLPAGFENVNPLNYFVQDALQITDYGFYDTMAVPPGKNMIAFSYTLAIKSESVAIVKKLSLTTTNLVIFAELENGSIEGLGQPTTTANQQGAPMKYYKFKDLDANSVVAFQITGLAKSKSGSFSRVVLAIVFGIISVAAISKLWFNERTGKS